jgi:glycosyltransferase involved in cell wall biosynthesis
MSRFTSSLKSRFARSREALRAKISLIGIDRYNLLLIAEGKGWILDDFSAQVLDNLSPEWRGHVLDVMPERVRGKVLHFVERYRFLRSESALPLSQNNRVIVTWWHGGSHTVENQHVTTIMGRLPEIGALPVTFHITSSLYRPVLEDLSITPDKIVLLPMGVERARFVQAESREATKTRLGVPAGKFVIGYFQRDGEHEPKLIKGPDVFIDVIERLWAQRDDLFVLLAGPDRGYVKRGLDRLGVPYEYAGWVPFTGMAPYYFASDLYLITSREEGGPAAVLECMATGTPLISTRVGMAVDVIRHGDNGFLAEIEDRDALAGYALSLMQDAALRGRISEKGLETAQAYDWKLIAPQYAERLYSAR